MWVPIEEWEAEPVEPVGLDEGPYTFLIDNSALVRIHDEWDQRESGWRSFVQQLRPGDRVISDITRWEFLHPADRRSGRVAWLDELFVRERIPQEASDQFAELLDEVLGLGRGSRIGKAADGLLMAHARAKERVVITRDVRDFCKVPRLKLLALPESLRR